MRSRGFTLVEMAIVVAVIAIGVSIAAMTMSNVNRSERRREIIRNIVGLASQARGAALALGSAARTPRATLDPSCMGGLQAIFSDTGSGTEARAAIAFLPGVNVTCGGPNIACCPVGDPVPCDLVVWSDAVRRVASGVTPWNGDNFVVGCRSQTLGEREVSMLDAPNFANFALPPVAISGTNAFFVTLDDRGFATPPTAAPSRVAIRAQVGGAVTQKGVLILSSGLACMQGSNTECARQL